MRVLVAYATSHHSTAGIATRIASGLRSRGLDAEARQVTSPIDVDEYDAVVLGSAVHGGKWLPEAADFARDRAGALLRRPVWLFSVSTVGDEESMFPPRVARHLRSARGDTDQLATLWRALAPRGHRNFAGAISPSDWPGTGRAFFRAMGGRYGDHRNWAAVDRWADEIALALTAQCARPER